MIGLATDIRAPDLLDSVQLNVTRMRDGFPEEQLPPWTISGLPDQPFNLPGSYGVYSPDGSEVKVQLDLVGLKDDSPVVTRSAILSLVNGKTLFVRLGLVTGCMNRSDCGSDQTCVEGRCSSRVIDQLMLPDYDERLVTELTCNSGTAFINTADGSPMPLSDDAASCPAGLCSEGTCLKPDPSMPTPDGGDQPDLGPTSVQGTNVLTFVNDTTMSTQPVDLSSTTINAFVPDGMGGFAMLAGTGLADGTFSIPNVPQGSYLLQIGTQYFVTTSHSLDLGFTQQGRADAVTAPAGSTVAFSGNILPWDTVTSGLFVAIPQLGMDAVTIDASQLLQGATTMTNNVLLDWSQNPPSLLVDASKGDQLLVTQFARNMTAPAIYDFVAGFGVAMPFTQTAGAQSNAIVNIASVPASQSFMLDWPRSQFDALLASTGPNAGFRQSALILFSSLQANSHFLGNGTLVSTADNLQTDVQQLISYGDPYPASWTEAVQVQYLSSIVPQVVGAEAPSQIGGFIINELASNLNGKTIAPRLGTVSSVRIANTDALGPPITITTLTPTVSWVAPTLGVPRYYRVQVADLQGTGIITIVNAGQIQTEDTSVTLPPGLLQAGHTYDLRITAIDDPAWDPLKPNASPSFPSSQSFVVSSVFTAQPTGGTAMDGGAPPARHP
jgi:hypothetical protein